LALGMYTCPSFFLLQRNHSESDLACPEFFALEMHTCPKIFASEMCFGEITLRVFLACPEFFALEMYTCPSFFCFGEITPKVLLACPEIFFSGVAHMSEFFCFRDVPQRNHFESVSRMSGVFCSRDAHMSEDFCFGDVLWRNYSESVSGMSARNGGDNPEDMGAMGIVSILTYVSRSNSYSETDSREYMSEYICWSLRPRDHLLWDTYSGVRKLKQTPRSG
jgi:hypothetical protein